MNTPNNSSETAQTPPKVYNCNIPPHLQVPGRDYNYTNHFGFTGFKQLGRMIQWRQTERRQPGILDRLLLANSHDEATDIWSSFLRSGAKPSSKTTNKALRILSNHFNNLYS